MRGRGTPLITPSDLRQQSEVWRKALKQRWLFGPCVAIALGLSLVTTARAGELRAGAAKVSITPTADEFPYTIGREKSFVGVHDDVYARALVLDNGTTRVALVAAEVESIPDFMRVVNEIAQAVGVPASNVMVIATHTHESLTVFIHGTNLLPVQKEEIEHVCQGAVQAAKEAASHLQPARIAFGRGEAYVNINNGEQAGLKSWYDPKGPSDKTLDVLRLESTTGQPIALLVDYATHAETMYRSVSKDGGYEVSGDIPGAVSQILETQPAGAPVVLFLPGAEADQLSIFKSLQPAVGSLPGADEGAAGWGLLDVQARRLAASVMEIVAGMRPGTSNVSLQAASTSVTCPGQRIHMDNQTGLVTTEEKPPVTIPLATIRIDDIAMAAVGGDVGSEIGREIRAASPVPHTIVTTMLAGAVGYILPDSAYQHPGHGLGGSPLKAGCAEHALPEGIASLLGAR